MEQSTPLSVSYRTYNVAVACSPLCARYRRHRAARTAFVSTARAGPAGAVARTTRVSVESSALTTARRQRAGLLAAPSFSLRACRRRATVAVQYSGVAAVPRFPTGGRGCR